MAARCEGWETRGEIDALLAEHRQSVTNAQLARWRREDLLPKVKQVQTAYRGSEVLYPSGTASQILAILTLLKTKRKFEYVRWELWWRGFPVDERYWKPQLRNALKWGDRVLKIWSWLVDRDDQSDRDATIYDEIKSPTKPNIVMSRIFGRLADNRLPTFFRVLSEIALGRFDGFEPDLGQEDRQRDEPTVIEALDFRQSDTHAIMGQTLDLTATLAHALTTASGALQAQPWSKLIDISEHELETARDDVRHALSIAFALHEATEWIFGRQAFGLRFAALLQKNAPSLLKSFLVVAMAAMRRRPNDFYSSQQIASMAKEAEQMRQASMRLRELWKTDKRFSAVLQPRRIRAGFKDQIAFNAFLRELKSATSMK